MHIHEAIPHLAVKNRLKTPFQTESAEARNQMFRVSALFLPMVQGTDMWDIVFKYF